MTSCNLNFSPNACSTIKHVPAYLLLIFCFSTCKYKDEHRDTIAMLTSREDTAIIEELNFYDMGYKAEKVFIYELNSDNEKDTIGLICTGVPSNVNPGQDKALWAYLTIDTSGQWTFDHTKGSTYEDILVSDSTLFIHPPRFNNTRMKRMQFLPYPYIEKYEDAWEWDFKIGKVWEIPGVYDIDSTVILKLKYKTEATLNSHPEKNMLHVEAISRSIFGMATARFTIKKNTGIVEMRYKDHNNKILSFTLMEENDNHTDLIAKNELLKKMIADHKQNLIIHAFMQVENR